VVPFSTVAPWEVGPHHFEIPAGSYDFFDGTKASWAKANMLTCVSFSRLDRLWVQGKYLTPILRDDDFIEILKCVANSIQLHVDCASAIR
jgi:uncharacterized protein YifN (PemK superfamily)